MISYHIVAAVSAAQRDDLIRQAEQQRRTRQVRVERRRGFRAAKWLRSYISLNYHFDLDRDPERQRSLGRPASG
jgi:hypothetical protein